MPFNTDLIPEAIERFRRERDLYRKLSDRVAEICRDDIIEQNAIRAQVTSRVKTIKSLEGKLKRFSSKDDKNFKNVNDIFSSISDFSGVRIATYRFEDCERVAELIVDRFSGKGGSKIVADNKDKQKNDANNFYRAIHCQAFIPGDELVGDYDNLSGISCEVQICSIMAHVWNEIEHDIGYKPGDHEANALERMSLRQLGMNTRLGDLIISNLLGSANGASANETNLQDDEAPFFDVYDFVSRVRIFFTAPRFGENASTLSDNLAKIGVTKPQEVRDLIRRSNERFPDIQEEMVRFNDYLQIDSDGGLQMDPETSDILLLQVLAVDAQRLIDSYAGLVGHGMGRANRLYRLARKYREFDRQRSVIEHSRSR